MTGKTGKLLFTIMNQGPSNFTNRENDQYERMSTIYFQLFGRKIILDCVTLQQCQNCEVFVIRSSYFSLICQILVKCVFIAYLNYVLEKCKVEKIAASLPRAFRVKFTVSICRT